MRLQLKSIILALAITLAVARPNPEAQPEYSYSPPSQGVRQNFQPTWSAVPREARTRASEVTVEQVPIRLIQQSSVLNKAPPGPPPPPNRGAYYFPSGPSSRLQQYSQGGYNSPQRYQQAINNNAGSTQQYRHNDIPQQRYLPHNYQQQYDRQQQSRFMNFGSDSLHRYNNNYQTPNNFPPTNKYPINNYNPVQNYNNQNSPLNNYNNQNTPVNNYNNQNSPINNFNNQNNFAPQNNYSPSQNHQQTPAPTPGYNPEQTTGYNYEPPSSNAPLELSSTPTPTTTTEASVSNSSADLGPRISIAISKSTVIHTGKGSYQIDEKTGLPRPLIAEAHSYATLPEDKKSATSAGDTLSGAGTGNIPIITRGTPPEDEEEEVQEEETEANTEEPTTPLVQEVETTPAPVAPTLPHNPIYSSSWPLKSYGGHHAHVVIAPGQTQYFAIGTSAPVKHFYTPTIAAHYLQPYTSQYYGQPTGQYYGQYYNQPLVQYAQQYGAYHPLGTTNNAAYAQQYFPIVVREPFSYNSVSGPDACTGKNENTEPTEQQPLEEERATEQGQEPAMQPHMKVIYKGGVAVAGPGGSAEAGRGGTAIVGPGGTAYSSPAGVSVVGPGGKVLLQGTDTVLAKGPIIYYHKP